MPQMPLLECRPRFRRRERNLFWSPHVTNHNDSGSRPQADADVQALLQVKKYRDAFALLAPRYRDKVFRLTFSMLHNHAMAEDTTQDILLRVWKALPGYGAQASLSTWIYAISRNACLSELRKKRPTDLHGWR